jgi:hypothetical protein
MAVITAKSKRSFEVVDIGLDDVVAATEEGLDFSS